MHIILYILTLYQYYVGIFLNYRSSREITRSSFICVVNLASSTTLVSRMATEVYLHACMHAKLLQLCLIFYDPMHCSQIGSSVHVILQARILDWTTIPCSRGSYRPRDGTHVSCTAGKLFTI